VPNGDPLSWKAKYRQNELVINELGKSLEGTRRRQYTPKNNQKKKKKNHKTKKNPTNTHPKKKNTPPVKRRGWERLWSCGEEKGHTGPALPRKKGMGRHGLDNQVE